MDFLDPNKKRSNRIKLYFGYVLVAIAIGLGALVLLFVVSGYGLDKNGHVIQNGLVFFDSHPSGAQVYIEGIHNKFKDQSKTANRMTLNEGQYKVSIQKDGYRNWERTFSLTGGSVERMVYPFLFPTKLETSNLKTYTAAPAIVTESPDRHWVVTQQPGKIDTFDVYDTSIPEKGATSFSIPAGVLSAAQTAQSLEVVEWSNDNSNILMKHTFDDKNEFVVINKDKTDQSFNVTTLTGQQPSSVMLKDKAVNQLYLQLAPGGLLESYEVKTKTLTPLVGKALAYKSHGDDMLVYITAIADKTDVVAVHILSGGKDYVLRELPVSDNYLVDVARYSNDWYIAVGASNDNQVYIYKNPLTILTDKNAKTSLFARTLRIKNPQHVSFSANTQFIAVQSGQQFVVYNAENDRQYKYKVPDSFDSGRPAKWMDGNRLTSSTGKTVYVFDYDGINYQKLMPINTTTDVMFDRDYENSFTLAPAEANGASSLTRTKLLVTN